MLILNGTATGVEPLNIIQGDGETQPRLLSAAAQNFHTVRVVFDSNMLHYLEGGGLLYPANYNIYSGAYSLAVLRIDRVSDTTYDLTTEEQLNLRYRIVVSNVYDEYGTIIDPLHNMEEFVGIRPLDTTEEMYLFSGTEAGLNIKYVDGLLDFDFDPPEVRNQDPAANEKFVPINQNLVSFDVVDEYAGVVFATLDAYIDGYWALKGGIIQSPFDGPDSYSGAVAPGGTWEGYSFIFDYDYEWEADKQIDLRVLAEDAIGNATDTQWWFRTPERVPPTAINRDPATNESRVSVLKEVFEFDIISERTEVLAGTIDAYVDGTLMLSNETIQAPFDGPDAYFGHIITIDGYDGYKVKFDYTNSPWDSFQTISIQMIAEDAYGFVGNESWSFRTEDLYPPSYKVATVLPVPGTDGADPNAIVQIEIYDTGSGVKQTSIHAWVDGVHAYDGTTDTFAVGFNGPLSSVTAAIIDGYDGYKIVVDKETPFGSGSTILAEVYATDNEDN